MKQSVVLSNDIKEGKMSDKSARQLGKMSYLFDKQGVVAYNDIISEIAQVVQTKLELALTGLYHDIQKDFGDNGVKDAKSKNLDVLWKYNIINDIFTHGKEHVKNFLIKGGSMNTAAKLLLTAFKTHRRDCIDECQKICLLAFESPDSAKAMEKFAKIVAEEEKLEDTSVDKELEDKSEPLEEEDTINFDELEEGEGFDDSLSDIPELSETEDTDLDINLDEENKVDDDLEDIKTEEEVIDEPAEPVSIKQEAKLLAFANKLTATKATGSEKEKNLKIAKKITAFLSQNKKMRETSKK